MPYAIQKVNVTNNAKTRYVDPKLKALNQIIK